MTRKDYIKAAAMIRKHYLTINPGSTFAKPWNDAIETMAREMADWFAADNPNFDRQRFLTACGLED